MFPSGSAQRKGALERTMELIKQGKYDIAAFSFPQLVSFATLVTSADVENMGTFQVYLDRALSLGHFTDQELSDNFGSFTDLVHLYALSGCLREDQTMLKYLMIVVDKIQITSQNSRLPDKVNDQLVKIVWTMVYRDIIVMRQKQDYKSNPLVPRMLEFLINYRRASELTKLEML